MDMDDSVGIIAGGGQRIGFGLVGVQGVCFYSN